jgi:hypothetical protein
MGAGAGGHREPWASDGHDDHAGVGRAGGGDLARRRAADQRCARRFGPDAAQQVVEVVGGRAEDDQELGVIPTAHGIDGGLGAGGERVGLGRVAAGHPPVATLGSRA